MQIVRERIYEYDHKDRELILQCAQYCIEPYLREDEYEQHLFKNHLSSHQLFWRESEIKEVLNLIAIVRERIAEKKQELLAERESYLQQQPQLATAYAASGDLPFIGDPLVLMDMAIDSIDRPAEHLDKLIVFILEEYHD